MRAELKVYPSKPQEHRTGRHKNDNGELAPGTTKDAPGARVRTIESNESLGSVSLPCSLYFSRTPPEARSCLFASFSDPLQNKSSVSIFSRKRRFFQVRGFRNLRRTPKNCRVGSRPEPKEPLKLKAILSADRDATRKTPFGSGFSAALGKALGLWKHRAA